MTPKSRSYYDLDSYWSAGELVDISSVVTPNVVEVEQPPPEDVVSASRGRRMRIQEMDGADDDWTDTVFVAVKMKICL